MLMAWIVVWGGLPAQSEPESSTEGVLLQSQSGKKDVMVPVGTRMNVNFRQDQRTYRGMVLQAVTDSAMVLDGDTVEPRYILRIGLEHNSIGRMGKNLTLVSIAVILTMFLLIILAVLFFFNPAAFLVIGVLIILLGLPFILAFPLGLVVGIILWAVGSSKYHLGAAWKAVIMKNP